MEIEAKGSAVLLIALSGYKVKLILKLLILGVFLCPYHRHLLYLWYQSMTSTASPKSCESERISYTAHSIIREKAGYNLNFNFSNTSICTDSIFNSYIFATGRKDSDRLVGDGIKIFTIHYPQVSQQKSEDLVYFLLNISIAILSVLKTLRKSKTRSFSVFHQLCLHYLPLNISNWDLENTLNNLKVSNKKCFISSESPKTYDKIASNNLKKNFFHNLS